MLESQRDFFLKNQNFAGLASRGSSTWDVSDSSMQATATITNVSLSNSVLTVNGSFSVLGGFRVANNGGFRPIAPISATFAKTFRWNESNSLAETTSVAESGFSDPSVVFSPWTNTLAISWTDDPGWNWNLSLSSQVKTCPQSAMDTTTWRQSKDYYIRSFGCQILFRHNQVAIDSWELHASIYLYALMEYVVEGQLGVDNLVVLINRFPRSIPALISSVDPQHGLLGRIHRTFAGGDFIIRKTDGVEQVWQAVRPQLTPESRQPSACAGYLESAYSDGPQAYLWRACVALNNGNHAEAVQYFNEALTSADAIDWETNLAQEFRTVSSAREDQLTTVTGLIAAEARYGSVQDWSTALANADFDQYERYRFEQILKKLPGYFVDASLSGQTQQRQPFICALYDQVGENNREMAFDNAILDFLAGAPGEVAEIATGLVAGNLTECPQTLSFSSSEIAKNSRAILIVLAKNAATDEASRQAFRQACRRFDNNDNGVPRGRLRLAARAVRIYLTRSCSDFINDESGSVPGQRVRPADQPVSPELPQGVSRERLGRDHIERAAPSARFVNAGDINEVARRFGSTHPPFRPGTILQERVVREPVSLVRFYGGEGPNAAELRGNFMMRLEDVQGESIAAIRNRFAIPPNNSMDQMAVIDVKPGSRLISGPANPHETWGEGGGTQFYLNEPFADSTEIPVQLTDW